jgi:RimJ/RimL family protein N-acetyltransferase
MVTIEEISNVDVSNIVKWKSDRELSRMIMSSFFPINTEEAKSWLSRNSNDKNQKLNGIYLHMNNEKFFVGITRLMFIDFHSGTTELGIFIGEKDNKGKGIGREALMLTIRQAFEELKLQKIFLKVSKTNLSALNLYLKCGFEIEGELHEHYYNGECYENVLYMSKFKLPE